MKANARSADVMSELILNDAKVREDLQSDPEDTLRKTADQAKNQTRHSDAALIFFRTVIIALALITVMVSAVSLRKKR
jgi:hypothetical protein